MKKVNIILSLITLMFITINSKAQTIDIIFPQYGSSNVALDARIQIQIRSNYIFDTLSLPKIGLFDSLLQDRGVIGFWDMTYECETDSCKALCLFMGGFGFVDSVSTDLKTIWIRNQRNFNYFTNYGLMYSNIKVIDTSTSNAIEIDSLIPNLFVTIQKPLKFIGTSFQSTPLTCKDNSFLVHFNIPLTQFQGENGYIVAVDTIQFIDDTLPNMIKPIFYPMNANIQLVNNNKSLLVTLDTNFNDEKLYYLNVFLSRITGDETDDIGFSFHSLSAGRVNIHAGPMSDLKPENDSVYFVRPGSTLNVFIKPSNSDYVFDRWVCVNCPPFLNNFNDKEPTLNLEFTCENIIPLMNLYPIYRKLRLDTCIFILPRNESGNPIGEIIVKGALDSLNDSTFVFKEGSNFSFCYNTADSIGFSHWKVNNVNTDIESRCLVNIPLSELSNNNDLGPFIWEPIPILLATPCSTVVVNIKLKYVDDDNPPYNSTALIKPVLKVVYQGIEYPMTFTTSQLNTKIAESQLILPSSNNQLFTIYFEEPNPIMQGYEFYQLTYDKGPDYNLGSSKYNESIQRLINQVPISQRFWTLALAKGVNNDCENNIEITIRKKRFYIKVSKVMRYDEKLPSETSVGVAYYKSQNNDELITEFNNPNGLYEFIEKRANIKNEINEIIKTTRYFEAPYGFLMKFAPYIKIGSGFEFFEWEPPNYIEDFTDLPIIGSPLPNSLGIIQINKDISVQAVFQSGFKLDKIGYLLEDGSWHDFSADEYVSINPSEYNKDILMALNQPIGYTSNPSFSDGYGSRTGRVRFIFNRGLDLNQLEDGAIKFINTTLYEDKSLHGKNTKYLSDLDINTHALTKDGKYKVLEMDLFTLENAQYNLGLAPMSSYKLEIDKTKIKSENNSSLQNEVSMTFATRFPKMKFKLDKVFSRGSHDPCYAPRDEVYGYFWMGHRNTDEDGTPFSASDIYLTQKERKIPYDETFENDQDYLITDNIYINNIGQYSYIGLGWLFYDKDCGSFYAENQATLDAIFDTVEKFASSDNAKSWGISSYIELAMAIFKIAGLICQMDEDDYLGSQGLIFQHYDFWKGNDNNDLRSINYSLFNKDLYFPMYQEHYYKQSKGSIDFYFRKILY